MNHSAPSAAVMSDLCGSRCSFLLKQAANKPSTTKVSVYFFPERNPKTLLAKSSENPNRAFRAGIKVDGLLIEPYQKGFPDAVLRPGKIVRRMYREFLVLLHCVVVQRQALARNAVRALLRIRKTMKRTFVSGED